MIGLMKINKIKFININHNMYTSVQKKKRTRIEGYCKWG
jgi:hypothetical protein